MNCRFLGAGAFGRANSIDLGPNTNLDRQVIVLTGSVNLTQTVAVTVRCTATSTDGNFLDIGFTAVRVGALTET